MQLDIAGVSNSGVVRSYLMRSHEVFFFFQFCVRGNRELRCCSKCQNVNKQQQKTHWTNVLADLRWRNRKWFQRYQQKSSINVYLCKTFMSTKGVIFDFGHTKWLKHFNLCVKTCYTITSWSTNKDCWLTWTVCFHDCGTHWSWNCSSLCL